jgi:hypothetical protein
MKNYSKSSVEGVFYNIRVLILDEKVIRVHNEKKQSIEKFKPYVDKIAQYLIDEGFVTEIIPKIQIVSI